PATVGSVYEAKAGWEWTASQSCRQVQPGEPRRRRQTTSKTQPPRGKVDVPIGAGRLGLHQRKWHLGKLQNAVAIDVAGQHQVTSKFGVFLARPPQGLALLHSPTRSGYG